MTFLSFLTSCHSHKPRKCLKINCLKWKWTTLSQKVRRWKSNGGLMLNSKTHTEKERECGKRQSKMQTAWTCETTWISIKMIQWSSKGSNYVLAFSQWFINFPFRFCRQKSGRSCLEHLNINFSFSFWGLSRPLIWNEQWISTPMIKEDRWERVKKNDCQTSR